MGVLTRTYFAGGSNARLPPTSQVHKINSRSEILTYLCSVTHGLHEDLCHPGVTRTLHFVRGKNMPYSVEKCKSSCPACQVCSEIKPRFIRRAPQTPSSSCNRYLLTVVDEYSRFPFAFLCADVAAATVIKHLTNLFSVFGNPSFCALRSRNSLHVRGTKGFLHCRGIATSRTTAF